MASGDEEEVLMEIEEVEEEADEEEDENEDDEDDDDEDENGTRDNGDKKGRAKAGVKAGKKKKGGSKGSRDEKEKAEEDEMEDGDPIPEKSIDATYSYGVDDQGLPQRKLKNFVVKKGKDMVSICMLDEAPKDGDEEQLLAVGGLLSDQSRPKKVAIGPLKEWCIEYSVNPILWVRSEEAWYNLQSPAMEYETFHKMARSRFEISSRVYLLCTTLESKQTTYKNVVKLLERPFHDMMGYTEEEILAEGGFILEQANSLRVPSLSGSGFVKGLKERLKKQAMSTGFWNPPEEISKVLDDRLRKRAGKILATLMKHKYVTPFTNPVDPARDNAPDYHKKVKVPMDLGTVMEAYNKGMYTSTKDLVDDVRLVWNNCRAYHTEESEIYKYMLILEKQFESQIIAANFEESKSSAVLKSNIKNQKKSEKKKKETKAVAKRKEKDGEGDQPKEKKKRKSKKSEDQNEDGSEANGKKSEPDIFLPEVKEDAEIDEDRTCVSSTCENNARVGSKYCSSRCGLLTAYGKLKALKSKPDKSQIILRTRRARLLGIDVAEYLRGTS